MADGTVYESEQIIDLDATDTLSRDRMAVESILFRGTAAGTFEFKLGNATINVTTGSNDLSKQVQVNRSTNYVELVSAPAGGKAYVFLEQKR